MWWHGWGVGPQEFDLSLAVCGSLESRRRDKDEDLGAPGEEAGLHL